MKEKELQPQENKMGVMPVPKLLMTMAVPMIISMLVQALYNIVDSVYVSRLSENALTAVSLAFPVQNLMISVATGTGVGINALLSKSLGEKHFDRANKAAVNGVFLGACSYVVFAILGLTLSHFFFAVQTDIAEIVDGGAAYLTICAACSIGVFMQVTFERLLQATGNSFYAMICQAAGAVINIIFDPICIFTLGMGVAGAAVATVFGQLVGCGLGIYFNIAKNKEIHLHFRGFRPDGDVIRRIYTVGVPSIIMSSIGSVMTFCMNQILIAFTETAATVFGVYFKLQSFIFMPIFGLNNAMVPIVAYNYGARKPDRMIHTFKLSVVSATGIMFIGVALFEGCPDLLLGFFNPSEQMLEIGRTALRIIGVHFLIAGTCIVCSSVFQALGQGVQSLIISLVRQLFVLLPAAWLLARTGRLALVWWAFPIAEVVSLILCMIFLRRVYVRDIKPMVREQK